ncbi:MAG: SDR family NAD(P)-dependent oxidoreductase [Proteobacteria bacterium]|nr:MAG: SDR family NAD(P)-dependent oxidoreductase [Pseudomonadota bacterium]
MKLTGNTILITGGGSGIGLGLAEAFKALGNEVIAVGRSESKLETAKTKGLHVLKGDVGSLESVQMLASEAIKRFPALNVVIHNAGIMQNEKLTTRDNSKTAEDTVHTNLLGPIYLTNALLPHLLKQQSSTIITVTSGLAFLPLSMTPTYCATKAAIHSYTQSLRFQLRETSVGVKEIAPPYVATTLMGERQASDPHAMPLKDFIDEVMKIFKESPEADEIMVKNVLPLRNSAFQGAAAYKELFEQRNQGFLAARRAEWDKL